MGKSSLVIPEPLSVICNILIPPSLAITSMTVEPASMEFSRSSFKAFTGETMISPAAIRFTTVGSKA
ncbi:hypothetical protein WICPIJ_002562 [Wickerhamomyces pijperi]|uniref:Uncharacterized protein n=1 Tax=Wickerhamomyces pijperi TaxID=599730 RepID=A0A9P8QB99_WICPI|nr:hypothetical protein WICPIJ_002562 [Wickerhamomyces pijperi]